MDKNMENNQFKDVLCSGEFAITGELGPPKGSDTEELKENIAILKSCTHAINVTDNQSAVMKMSSLGACIMVKNEGGEPIFQVTGRDRNRMAMGSDILAAYAHGIRNILCLSGDHVSVGDHDQAQPVFDIDSVQLIQGVKGMARGLDFCGNELDGPVTFFCGASHPPASEPQGPHLMKLRKKVEAGAEFIQTQAVFDVESMRNLKERAGVGQNVKILAGVLLLSSPGMAKYVNNNIPGINVPAEHIEALSAAPKGTRLQKGIEIAGEFIARLKEEKVCDGVHIMAIGKEAKVPDIIDAAGISIGR
jgi:5,10-methylenetetrahydrofolate reductase